MNWLDRFTFVIKSSVTSIREKIEDPPRMIHQLIVDMEEEHQRVRAAVAESIADEIQLGQKVEHARAETDRWYQRAKDSISRGDEKGSSDALEQKLRAENRAANLEKEHQTQKQQVEKLRRAVKELEDKIRQARQKRTLLLARMARAESEQKIRGALNHAEGVSALAAFQRLEDRVERAEALANAHDLLDGKDVEADALETQFAQREFEENLQRELADLKKLMVGESS
jgi:phage shock protein A